MKVVAIITLILGSSHAFSIDRREALGFAATGVFSAYVVPPVETANAIRLPGQGPPPLFKVCEQLETANDIGKIGIPKFKPNSIGSPEKHIPIIELDGQTVSMSANHVMTPEHYIQYMWLKDAKTNEVVLAKELAPSENAPLLKARVPSGVTLRPYLFCNLHQLWKGDEFTVA
jgi:superoxide reductase